jgi:hypothetical protein
VVIGPIEGRGHVDLRVKSLLIEPNVFAWIITLIDGDGGQTLDTSKKIRFVLNENLPMNGLFGLIHDWERPATENILEVQTAKVKISA